MAWFRRSVRQSQDAMTIRDVELGEVMRSSLRTVFPVADTELGSLGFSLPPVAAISLSVVQRPANHGEVAGVAPGDPTEIYHYDTRIRRLGDHLRARATVIWFIMCPGTFYVS